MVQNADAGSAGEAGPVRLPPTQTPKPRKPWPRWARSLAFVVVLALVGVIGSAVVNREVTDRLATVPVGPTTTTSSTIAVPTTEPPRPSVSTKVLGRRVTSTSTSTTSTSTTVPPAPETPSEVITALDALKVQEEHPAGYRASHFGFWTDDDKDGCNTRNEVLIAESVEPANVGSNCRVQGGRWYSVYDDQTFVQLREVTVDHVISLAEAWESGAWQWTDEQRSKFLNDLDHPEALIVVSVASNDAKGEKDPGAWLPMNQSYRCTYLSNWVHMKTLFKLSVDPGEREAIAAAALRC